VTTVGELELDDAAEDDLAVVADGGFEDVVETQFVAAADCHIVAERVEGQAVYQLGCAQFLHAVLLGVETFGHFAVGVLVVPDPHCVLSF
jgi:hypothetical protein